MVFSVVCVCTVHAGECKVVDTHVRAGRGQGRMLGVFFNHTLPYCLGTEALTELEAHCSDLPSPPNKFSGSSCPSSSAPIPEHRGYRTGHYA